MCVCVCAYICVYTYIIIYNFCVCKKKRVFLLLLCTGSLCTLCMNAALRVYIFDVNICIPVCMCMQLEEHTTWNGEIGNLRTCARK
jgi:hypothetical protein